MPSGRRGYETIGGKFKFNKTKSLIFPNVFNIFMNIQSFHEIGKEKYGITSVENCNFGKFNGVRENLIDYINFSRTVQFSLSYFQYFYEFN